MDELLEMDVVKKQLELLKFRASFPAFGFDSKLDVQAEGSSIKFTWTKDGYKATLDANLSDYSYKITTSE